MKNQLDRKLPVVKSRPFRLVKLIRLMAVFGLLVTVIAQFAQVNWIADLFAQFKLQWAIGLGIVILSLAIGRQWWWIAACLIGLVINAIPIWLYFSEPSTPVRDGERMVGTQDEGSRSINDGLRLLSLNVLTSNRRYQDVVSLIESEDSDFVVLLEVNADWQQSLGALDDRYTYRHFETREDNFGIAFLSKQPWSSIEVFHSKSHQLPSIDVRFEGLKQELNAGSAEDRLSDPLRIIATHPIPPISEFNWRARNEQLFNVAGRFDSTASNIMVGDFNLTPWSPFFAEVAAAGNLRDAALGFGVSPSWHVIPVWIGGLKIDHALVGPGVETTSYRIGPEVGSDHRAVIIGFRAR